MKHLIFGVTPFGNWFDAAIFDVSVKDPVCHVATRHLWAILTSG